MSPAAALQSIHADPAPAPVQLRAACRQPAVPGWEVSRAVLVGKLAVLCLGGVHSKQKKKKKKSRNQYHSLPSLLSLTNVIAA